VFFPVAPALTGPCPAADNETMRSIAYGLLALLAVLAVLLRHGAAAAKAGDSRLSEIASELSGRQVTIRCEGLSGALIGPRGESGRTEFTGSKPASVSFLREGICQTLHAYARSRKDCLLPCEQPLDVAWSLNALAHESYHLAGIRDEARTECAALRAIGFVAHSLGASPQQARAVSAYSFAQLPGRMPAEYSSAACRR
jgi:hypothetical protein